MARIQILACKKDSIMMQYDLRHSATTPNCPNPKIKPETYRPKSDQIKISQICYHNFISIW